MKRSFSCGALAALAIFGLACAASAQDVQTRPIGVSIRAGIFGPIDSGARDVGTAWVAFGAQYKLLNLNTPSTMPTMRSSLALSVDYYGRNGFSNTPVLVNYVGKNGGVFYSAGAGIGFSRVPGGDKAKFTYQLGVGYEFATSSTTPFFVEGKFWGCEESELNGFAVYAGIRL